MNVEELREPLSVYLSLRYGCNSEECAAIIDAAILESSSVADLNRPMLFSIAVRLVRESRPKPKEPQNPLWHRLAVLQGGDQDALYMVYVVKRGDDFDGAAERLGIPSVSLRVRVNRGLRKLRAMGMMDLIADLMA